MHEKIRKVSGSGLRRGYLVVKERFNKSTLKRCTPYGGGKKAKRRKRQKRRKGEITGGMVMVRWGGQGMRRKTRAGCSCHLFFCWIMGGGLVKYILCPVEFDGRDFSFGISVFCIFLTCIMERTAGGAMEFGRRYHTKAPRHEENSFLDRITGFTG